MAKEKKVLKYRDILCDSSEEISFLMWLHELKDLGYITKIERSISFELSQALKMPYKENKALKTKTKVVDKNLDVLREHVYTPEFQVCWHTNKFTKDPSNLTGLFFSRTLFFEDPIMLFEVKPKFDQNNMSRLFKINQKWMWDKHGIFVNLVIPEKLFKETFTPKEYLLTPTGKPKKINWKVITCEQFLNH